LQSWPPAGRVAELGSFGRWSLSTTIEDYGAWGIGSEPADLETFLAALTQSEGGYLARTFRLVRCSCGSERFKLDRASEVTRRACATCGSTKFICRESEDWDEAEADEGAEAYSCVACKSPEANVVVGFAGNDDCQDFEGVKWFFVGVRCAECGILGCFHDGKIGSGPAAEVYESI